jgi:hypothetical protein
MDCERHVQIVKRSALIASLVDVKEQRDVAYALGWLRRKRHGFRYQTGADHAAVAVLEIVT